MFFAEAPHIWAVFFCHSLSISYLLSRANGYYAHAPHGISIDERGTLMGLTAMFPWPRNAKLHRRWLSLIYREDTALLCTCRINVGNIHKTSDIDSLAKE